jgi:3-hydroxy-9,10-secoandrosta-1,3,5(10)-triene-9,17-dione monooxygenase
VPDELTLCVLKGFFLYENRVRTHRSLGSRAMNKVVSVKQRVAAAPSPEALVASARAMIPVLKERAARAEAERRIPDATIADMQAAGFFRVLQPRRWGGYEMDPQVFYDIQIALSEGCMSTGWVYGTVGGHPYEIALFPDAAQREVWAEDDAQLVSSSYQPVGTVERVADGFLLSGRWGFSSGCDHCQWVLLGAMVPPAHEGEAPDMRTFLLPRRDYTIIDAWDTFGLKGTGSNDILVERVLVPEYRTHRAVDGFLCQNPGQAINDAPLFRLPWAQVFVRLVSTAAIGATRGAIQAALDITRTRVSTNTGKAAKSDPIVLNAIARAYAEVDEMEAVLVRNFTAMMASARSLEAISVPARTLYRYQSASVVQRCAALVDAMMPALGGRAIYNSSPIVRYWLDLNAARAHIANDPHNFAPDLANGLLGEPPGFMFL